MPCSVSVYFPYLASIRCLVGLVCIFYSISAFARERAPTVEQATAKQYAATAAYLQQYQLDPSMVSARPWSQCATLFADNHPPTQSTHNAAQHTAQTLDLCLPHVAIRYNPTHKLADWSANYVTAEDLNASATLKRDNIFHSEAALPPAVRAALYHYKGSTWYDRGHLTPNADLPDRVAQFSGFSLANIIPQQKFHNQETWRNIEEAVRVLIKQHGDAYVVTGTLHLDKKEPKLKKAISIPSHVYKIILFRSSQIVGVYFSPNDGSGRIRSIALDQLEDLSTISFFPKQQHIERQRALQLPLNARTAYRLHDLQYADSLPITPDWRVRQQLQRLPNRTPRHALHITLSTQEKPDAHSD